MSDAAPDPAGDLQGLAVMVIDDSPTIRKSAERFLAEAGCEVLLAEDGFAALAQVADRAPDVVLCDILMPRLDGYQTCALLKRHPRHAAIPVIMLSSKDGLFDRARGRLAGSGAHLTKPFSRETLLAAIAGRDRPGTG
jgi:twitching motility two-component system response regulator PilG